MIMLRLEKVTLREIRLPLREPFIISSGEQHLRRILLIEAESGGGATGWSECVAQEYPNYSPETIDTAWHALSQWLIPLVLNRPIDHPGSVFTLLDGPVRGHLMAKASIEMACWAAAAELEGIALAELLGGSQADVPVGISIGLQPGTDVLIDKVGGYVAQGYRKIKLKIKPGRDLESLGAVRGVFGEELPLAADANSSYSLKDLDVLQAMDDLGLLMLEQPLHQEDLLRHADLQRQIRTPLCLDESITGPDRAEDMIRLGSGQIVNIKPGRVGGFAQSIAIHDLCRSRGVPVWCGGMLESGIGRGHNVALASLPNFTYPGDLSPSRRYWEQDIVSPEWTMSPEGMVSVPFGRQGLGVEIDLARVEDLTVRREIFGA